MDDSTPNAEPSADAPQRVRGRPFERGRTGNPGGVPRQKGVAAYIRAQTRNGEELIDMMLDCARGEMKIKRWLSFGGAPLEFECDPSHRDRLEALKFLIERGLGSELESVSPENETAGALAVYTSTQLLAVFDRVRQLPADAPALPSHSEAKSDDDT